MPFSRRSMIRSAALFAGATLANGPVFATLASPKPKKILILGGTGFIGPHTVRTAVQRGHEVSIFTRGKREADLPPGVERLVGDRNDDHQALEGRRWDAVLDNNCYDYRWVQNSTRLLKDATDHYLFVSSLSSYAMPADIWQEPDRIADKPLPLSAPLVPIPKDWVDGQEADYALMKVLGERIVQDAFPGRSTIMRPTLIVGPGDQTGRWSYWPVRLQRGGEVLAPGNPGHSTQIIDQRDLTEWHVHLMENRTTGIFNAAGPGHFLSMRSMLEQIGSAVNSDWRLTWVGEQFLQEQGIEPWSDMPAWVPNFPMMYVDVNASVAAGLRYRSLAETTRATLDYENARPADDKRAKPFSFTADRERAALAAWHSQNKS